MAAPKVHIARNQRYACILCGRCCRRFRVRLTEEEAARLGALRWGDEPDVPRDFVERSGAYLFFRRRGDGACVFQDGATGACRIHARFGLAVKALTCRGYPHNIASTWPGEVSVVARMDCPAVQRNAGPPLESRRREIEALVAELGTRGGFTAEQLEGLSREAAVRVTGALVRLVEEPTSAPPGTWALALAMAAERFAALGPAFLGDSETMDEVLPSFVRSVRRDAEGRSVGRVGVLSRVVFREWLAAYCRRDEELVRPGLGVRLRRTAALAGYAAGLGSLRVMGREHPDVPLRRAGLFHGRGFWEPSDHGAWECYRRLLTARLEAPQFFGVAYYGVPFFTGLRALLQTYALVLAAARCHAAGRSSRRIEAQDVHYAVGAVDHCLGRSPLLQWRTWRTVEAYFAGPRYARLLNTLGWE